MGSGRLPANPKDDPREEGGRGPLGLLAQSRLFVLPPLECHLPIYSPHSSPTANAPLSCCTALAPVPVSTTDRTLTLLRPMLPPIRRMPPLQASPSLQAAPNCVPRTYGGVGGRLQEFLSGPVLCDPIALSSSVCGRTYIKPPLVVSIVATALSCLARMPLHPQISSS